MTSIESRVGARPMLTPMLASMEGGHWRTQGLRAICRNCPASPK